MRRWVRDGCLAVALYVAVLVGGVVLSLVVSSAVGYLPYSDRPGPGWQQPTFSLGLLAHYLGWAALLLAPAIIVGTGLFVWLRVMRLQGMPQLAVRLIGGAAAAWLSMMIVAAGGWYIALAAFPVWIAGALGATWAAVLLPRYLGLPLGETTYRRRVRLGLVAITLATPIVVAWNLFVPEYVQDLDVVLVDVAPANDTPTQHVKPQLEPQEAALLASLFPHRELRAGMAGGRSVGGAQHRARIVVVVTGHLAAKARLRVPRGVSVVYVQNGSDWSMYPPDAPTLSDTLQLSPRAGVGGLRFDFTD